MGKTACGRQVVSVLLPRYACSAVCAWPGVCLNYTLSVESARKSSPCGVNWFGKREKVRPARENWLDFGVFGRVGRVFSRFGQDWAVAGRVFSRGNGWRGCWANSFARADSCPGLRRCRGRVGRVFRGLAKVRLLLGEFCTGWGGGVPVMGVGWCCCGRKFSLLGGAVLETRKSSPCGVNWFGKREKVRPAREKWLDFGVFGRAGRVFSRFGQDWAVAGRVFLRGNGWRGVPGEFCPAC